MGLLLKASDLRTAGAALGMLLDAIDDGEMTASTAMVRRLEGAFIACMAAGENRVTEPSELKVLQ